MHTDEGKLRQILLNLLSNAIKFTPAGSVTLQAGIANLTEGSGAVAPHQLWFEVRDTGLGIASAELDKLFEAFVQTDVGRQSRKGTGLGLFISRQLVQLLGGEISVKSSVEKGTCFRFYIEVGTLPEQTQADLPQFNNRQAIALAPNQPTRRILVVEDTPENRLLLVQHLTGFGFEVREAENGQEAIALWEEWNPHLILMDMRMPVLDGYEATQQIKATAKGQATLVIATTASVLEEERYSIYAAGCDDILCKPFSEQTLLTKLADYFDIRYLYEERLS